MESGTEIEKLRVRVRTLQAQLVAKEIDLEQLKLNSDQRLLQTQQQHSQLETQSQSLHTQLSQRDEALNRIKQENERLRVQVEEKDMLVSKLKKELGECRVEKDTFKNSLNATEAQLENKLTQIQLYSEQVQHLTEQNNNLQKELISHSEQLLPLQYQNSSLQIQIDTLKLENQRINQELNSEQEALTSRIRDFSSQISGFKLQAAEQQNSIQQLSESLAISKANEQQVRQSANKFREQILSLTIQHNELILQNEKEVSALQNALTLAKKSLAEKSSMIAQMDEEITAVKSEKDELQSQYSHYAAEVDKARELYQEEFAKKEKEVQSLQRHLEKIRQDLPFLDDVPAAPQSMNSAEIYQKYIAATRYLQKEREQARELKAALHQIQAEITVNAPVLKAQSEDYSKMRQSYHSLQQRLSETAQELKECQQRCHTLESTLMETQKLSESLRAENDDAYRQLNHLLKKSRSSTQSVSLILPSSLSDSNPSLRVSQDLITFSNIDELQLNNRALLQRVRDLITENENLKKEGEDYAARFIQQSLETHQRRYDDLKSQLDEKEQALALTKNELMALKSVQSFEESSFLIEAKASSDSSSSLIAYPYKSETHGCVSNDCPWKSELEQLKVLHNRVIEEESSLRKELNESISKLTEEKTRFSLATNRLQFELEFAEQKLSQSDSQVDALRNQLKKAQLASTEQTKIAIKMEEQVTNYRQELSASSVQINQLTSRVSVLESSLEHVENARSKLEKQANQLQIDKSSLQKVLDSFSNLKDTFISDHIKEKENWTVEKQNLSKSKEQLNEDLEKERTLRLKIMRDQASTLQVLQGEKERFMLEISEAQTKVVKAEAEAHELRLKIEELNGFLHTTQAQLNVLISNHRMISKEIPDLSADQYTTLNREQQLALDLDYSKREIEDLSRELVVALDDAKRWKNIAETNDGKLKQLFTSHQECLSNFELQLGRVTRNRDVLVERLKQAKDYSQECESRYHKLEQESNGKMVNLETQLNEINIDKQKLQERCNVLTEQVSSFTDRFERQVSLTKEAQSRYERELLDHAAHVTIVSQLQSTVDDLESTNGTLRAELKQMQDNLETAQRQKEAFESNHVQEIFNLRVKLDKLVNENQMLISRALIGDNSTDLQIVLERLQTEKEMADAERESQALEALRLKKELEASAVRIRNLQAELHMYTEKASGEPSSADVETQDLLLQQLRESNLHLRSEKDSILKLNDDLKHKLEIAQNNLEPHLSKIRELSAQVSTLSATKVALEEQIGKLMQRIEKLIHNYDQVDFEVHKQVLEELEAVKSEKDVCSGKIASLESELEFRSKEASEASSTAKHLSEELSKKTLEFDSLKEREEGRAKRLTRTVRTLQGDVKTLTEQLSRQPSVQSQSSDDVKSLVDLIEKSKELIKGQKLKIQQLEQQIKMKELEYSFPTEYFITNYLIRSKQLLKKLDNERSKATKAVTDTVPTSSITTPAPPSPTPVSVPSSATPVLVPTAVSTPSLPTQVTPAPIPTLEVEASKPAPEAVVSAFEDTEEMSVGSSKRSAPTDHEQPVSKRHKVEETPAPEPDEEAEIHELAEEEEVAESEEENQSASDVEMQEESNATDEVVEVVQEEETNVSTGEFETSSHRRLRRSQIQEASEAEVVVEIESGDESG